MKIYNEEEIYGRFSNAGSQSCERTAQGPAFCLSSMRQKTSLTNGRWVSVSRHSPISLSHPSILQSHNLSYNQSIRTSILLWSSETERENMAKIGYIRVSKGEQNEGLQVDALQKAGCEKWFSDKISGAKFERKGLSEALAYLRPGDVFVVWKLDRAGRSLKHLIELLNTLKSKQVEFMSVTEAIDTTTPGGKLIFHVMGALAEFERDLIRERTNAGLAAARARGRRGGRIKKLRNGKLTLAQRLIEENKHSIDEMCEMLGVSRATMFRYIKEWRESKSSVE